MKRFRRKYMREFMGEWRKKKMIKRLCQICGVPLRETDGKNCNILYEYERGRLHFPDGDGSDECIKKTGKIVRLDNE